jgi:hypothetical protein
VPTRIIRPHPPELTKILFELGERKLIARTTRQIGLHPDIQQIVEQRILGQGGV